MRPVLCILLSLAFSLTACSAGQSGFNNPSPNTQAAGGEVSTHVSDTGKSAQVVTTNVIVPIHLSQFVPCANGGHGEIVILSGNLHMVASTTITANNFHIMMSNNPQGVTGIGSVTGDKYQGTGVTRQGMNVSNAMFPENLTFVNNFRIIGVGTGNNLLVHENSHITVNANRTVTVNQTNSSIECK